MTQMVIFMQRLAGIVPRPRLRLIRFHGVLAPNARLRPAILPSAPVKANTRSAEHGDTRSRGACPHELGPVAHKTAGSGFKRRTPARRAKAKEGFRKRVFEIDIEQCPQCGGTLKIIATIEHPLAIAKVLACPPGHRPIPGAANRSTPSSLIPNRYHLRFSP